MDQGTRRRPNAWGSMPKKMRYISQSFASVPGGAPGVKMRKVKGGKDKAASSPS